MNGEPGRLKWGWGLLRRITIVGASLVGLHAAGPLRRVGFDGSVTLIGDEHDEPYDRPPFSKPVLAGRGEPYHTSLLLPADGAPDDVNWRLGAAASATQYIDAFLS